MMGKFLVGVLVLVGSGAWGDIQIYRRDGTRTVVYGNADGVERKDCPRDEEEFSRDCAPQPTSDPVPQNIYVERLLRLKRIPEAFRGKARLFQIVKRIEEYERSRGKVPENLKLYRTKMIEIEWWVENLLSEARLTLYEDEDEAAGLVLDAFDEVYWISKADTLWRWGKKDRLVAALSFCRGPWTLPTVQDVMDLEAEEPTQDNLHSLNSQYGLIRSLREEWNSTPLRPLIDGGGIWIKSPVPISQHYVELYDPIFDDRMGTYEHYLKGPTRIRSRRAQPNDSRTMLCLWRNS